MINTRLLNISLLASACISLPVAAQEKPYLGLDYSVFTYENSHPGASDAEPTAVRLRLGSVVAKYLAVEAQVAVGAGDDDITITTLGGTTAHTISTPVSYGVFARPQVSMGQLSLYALAGYSYVEFEYSPAPVAGGTDNLSTSDFSYGAGAQFDFGQNLGINASFTQYVEGLSSVNAGVVYRF